jgi:hypothetical protein
MADRTLDLRKAWQALPPDVQGELGMTAIAIGLANLATMLEEHELPAWRTVSIAKFTNYFDAASIEAEHRAGFLVQRSVLGGDVARLLPPDLSALHVRQCTECGCTDSVGCADGCHWVGPLLCSSCEQTAEKSPGEASNG